MDIIDAKKILEKYRNNIVVLQQLDTSVMTFDENVYRQVMIRKYKTLEKNIEEVIYPKNQ